MEQGENLGPYRIDRELGSGGMGKVYAATCERAAAGLDRGATVALKVVHPHLLDTEGSFKRFLREAQIGQRVRHQNVVRTLDCDAAGGAHFLVMEYVEGQTVRELAAELGRVPEELCRHVGREICKGLGAIHAAGAVHRDLKPENVLITPEHHVKVMDLGVARLVEASMRLSQTGAFVGSIEYAAPEQFSGGDVDGRTDLHALGVLLYEISSGQHPYRADGFRQVMRRVCEQPPRRLGEVHPQLSAFFEEVVHTLLAKAPTGRFGSAGELLTVLEQGEDSEWWHAHSTAIRAATKRPLRRIRIPRDTAVYGREGELDKLSGLYRSACSGEGGVVLLTGEAGIGKSRLVDELVGRLLQDGEDLNFLFGSYPPGGAATVAGAFSTAYREHFGDMGTSEYLLQTPLLVPAFDALLRGDATPTGCEPLTQNSLQTCFVSVTRALAAERPTVVLIDDLHFAPDAGRALFSALAMAAPGHRVLLIGSTRPGISEEWVSAVTRLDHATQVELNRLGPKDLGALLEDCFRSKRLALDLAGQIGTKSDGNPLFVFEIIRELREGRLITQREDGTWVSTGAIDEIAIPSSVLDLVNARVVDLNEEERELLDVAACWGFEFDPTLVADAVGMAALPAMKRFGLIERRHRLVRSVGRDYAFDHHQVKESLYQALNQRLREMYHVALADALERRENAAATDPEELAGGVCLDLCEHFLDGGAGERALRYLDRAMVHLQVGYLTGQAAALAERALAVPGLLTGGERARCLADLAYPNGPLDMLGRRERQLEAAEEAERLAAEAGDRELVVRAAQAQGSCHSRAARYAESVQAHRRAHALASEIGDDRARTIAEMAVGMGLFRQGNDAEAREWMERALASAGPIGDLGLISGALGSLGHLLMHEGHVAEAHRHQRRRLEIARELGLRRAEAGALSDIGGLYYYEGRNAEARRHFEDALMLCRATGHRPFEANVLANLAELANQEGRFADAQSRFEEVRELGVEIGHRLLRAVSAHGLSTAALGLGRLADARRWASEYLDAVTDIGDRRREYDALHNGAAIADVLGDRDGAAAQARRALELTKSVRIRSDGGEALLVLAGHAAEDGDRDEAERLYGEAVAGIRDKESPDVLARALLALADARLERGDHAAAADALSEAEALDEDVLSTTSRADLACLRSLLHPGDPAVLSRALSIVRESGEQLPLHARMRAWFRLWQVSGTPGHLDEAQRLLDDLLEDAPEESRAAMRSGVRAFRAVLAACDSRGGGAAAEAPTRVD